MIDLVAAAGTRRTIGAAAPGFVLGGIWPPGTPDRQVTVGFAAAGLMAVGFAAAGFTVAGFVTAGFAVAGFAVAGFVTAGLAAAGFAAVFLAAAGFAAVFFVGLVRAAVASFLTAAFGADPDAAALARGAGLEAPAVAFAPAGKAARMLAAWASSTMLRFVLTSTPCFFSQAIASATGILSSLASCPILVFAI